MERNQKLDYLIMGCYDIDQLVYNIDVDETPTVITPTSGVYRLNKYLTTHHMYGLVDDITKLVKRDMHKTSDFTYDEYETVLRTYTYYLEQEMR